MKKESSAYLIKENTKDGTKEYFDFETMSFKSEKPRRSSVVSTIDALTTLFESPSELEEYLSEPDSIDNENIYRYYIENTNRYYIENTNRTKRESKNYQVIWDDITLSGLSKVTDGNVDFTGNVQYNTLLEIMDEIAKEDSGLEFFLERQTSDDLRLNKESKFLIIAHRADKSIDLVGEFLKNFSNYMQCRALYLGYKKYKESRNKSVIKIISWKH